MRTMASHCAELTTSPPPSAASPVELFHLAPDAFAHRGVEGGRRNARGRAPPAADDQGHQDEPDTQHEEGGDPHEEIETAAGRGQEGPPPGLVDQGVPPPPPGLSRRPPLAEHS